MSVGHLKNFLKHRLDAAEIRNLTLKGFKKKIIIKLADIANKCGNEERRPSGKKNSLGDALSCLSLWTKMGSAVENQMPRASFCFTPSFRAAVGNIAAHPELPDSHLHETTPKFGCLFLNQLVIYKTSWKDLEVQTKGRSLEASESQGVSVTLLDAGHRAGSSSCPTEHVKCIPRRQRDCNKASRLQKSFLVHIKMLYRHLGLPFDIDGQSCSSH